MSARGVRGRRARVARGALDPPMPEPKPRSEREGAQRRAIRRRLAERGRVHSPGAFPVVALAPDDGGELEAAALRSVELERRGAWHGEWAELDPSLAPEPPADPRPDWRERFARAEPILLPGLVDVDGAGEAFAELLAERMRLFDELQEPRGLKQFLDRSRDALGPEFEMYGVSQPSIDARDLERVGLRYAPASARGRGPKLKDLWVKSAWLSDHPDDASLRLRCSFGREVDDDASRDLARHLAVTELAERLLPECRAVHEHEPLALLLHDWIGGECFLTQHIAYWNAPNGGALFHHDAFDEGEHGSVAGSQRGVLYVQLTGTSAWLALSLDDLAAHVEAFAARLAAGEAPWVRAALFPSDAAFAGFERVVRSPAALREELARPGCGMLAGLVNRGPEFTAWLADHGHAALLDAGDAIVLPNHGFERTCMHSVFSASDGPGYALSMGIRERSPDEPKAPEPGGAASWRRAERRRSEEGARDAGQSHDARRAGPSRRAPRRRAAPRPRSR